ncbi:hypothetical protein RJT34_14149 [Clitoria ternatea]|uniref:Uncharacterized protein n=1 Tax=Clitoria ternatea TaxID=43366 RepID=A0AAN9JSS3_CLITE
MLSLSPFSKDNRIKGKRLFLILFYPYFVGWVVTEKLKLGKAKSPTLDPIPPSSDLSSTAVRCRRRRRCFEC